GGCVGLGMSWCMGQGVATEVIAECIRSGGIWEAESNIEWLGVVSTPAAADRNASFTMERINLLENTAKASGRKCEFDQIREVPFVRKADDLALATSHLAQSPSASRVKPLGRSNFIGHDWGSLASLPMGLRRETGICSLIVGFSGSADLGSVRGSNDTVLAQGGELLGVHAQPRAEHVVDMLAE